ncbi:MAG: diguanylate cyclase [Hungatella sp.]|jgi:diguanylate cyclase (GGDEF)-like protein|nr:diguanylate cyclase [Hungatella sp.]
MLNIFVWFMLLATMGSVVLMVYAVASHSSERSFFLIFASICTFLYTAGYLLEIISTTLEASFMGVRVQKMGTPLLVVFNYLFIRDVYGEKRFNFSRYCLFFALPVFNLFTAQAFPLVQLHYTGIEYFHNGYFANCQGHPGPMTYVANDYNFLLVFLSIRRILKHLKGTNRLQKRQGICLLVSILIPLIVNIYHAVSYNYLRPDINPFAVSVSLALLLYSVRNQNLLNVVPLARAKVIESMEDAFIVCSKDFSFLDANQAARELFPELSTLTPGETMEKMKQFEGHRELCLNINGEMRFYKVTQTHIRQSSKNSGICIVFHDITDKEKQLKSLYGKATFDPLMHIYNRAAFFDLAGFMLNASEAEDRSYGLLMLALDHFKKVNDTYGHPCGDMVLETIAAMVRNHFRKEDIVGRYGGEEIVVLLENVSAGQMLDSVEKLRAAIENETVFFHNTPICITISIGMAHSPAGSVHCLEDMILQADLALYEAKNGGRNRACLYGGAVASS